MAGGARAQSSREGGAAGEPRSFGRRVLLLAGGTAVGQAIVIGASPLLTRIYTPEDFGYLGAYAAVLALLVAVASLRYHLAIPLPADDEDGAALLLVSLAIVVVVSALLAVVLALFASELFALFGAEHLQGFSWVLVLGVLGAGAYQAFTYWSIRKQSFRPLAITKVTQGLMLAVSQVGLGLITKGPFGLLVGDVVGRSAGTGMLARLSIPSIDLRSLRSWARVRANLVRYKRFPTFSTVSALLNSGGLQLPALLILSFYGPQVAGWYALTMRVFGLPMSMLGTSASQVYTSSIAELIRNREDPTRLFLRTSLRLLVIGLPISGLLAIVGPQLFALVFSSEWVEAGLFARILAPMFLVQFIASPLSQTLNVLERQDVQFWWDAMRLALVAGVLFAVNGLELSATASIVGVSASLFVAYVVLYLTCLYVIRRPRFTPGQLA